MQGLHDDSVLVFGGETLGRVNHNLARIIQNTTTQLQVKATSLKPWQRAGSCSVHFGDEIIVHGGNGGISNDSIRIQNRVFNG